MSESFSDLLLLASVIRGQTFKLKDDDPLTLFHKKSWARSMEDEEAEWHDAPLKSRVQHDGQDSNEHADEDEDNAMDVDNDNNKDDNTPGCYLLNTGMLKLWIRVEYIQIYNTFEVHYNQYPTMPGHGA